MIQIRSIVQKVTFLDFLGPISEFCHMCECCPMLLHDNKNHFRPFEAQSNDSNWMRSPKSLFFQFSKCQRGSKKESKKFSKNFIAFSCLEWLKNSQFFFFQKFQKSPKVGTVLGPFGPKTQNTTHQSSITPLLHSFYHILSSYKKLLKTVKPFSRYSTLKNRAIWLDEPFLAIFGQIRFFPKNLIRPLFTPCTPLTSCKISEKSNEAILRKTTKTLF